MEPSNNEIPDTNFLDSPIKTRIAPQESKWFCRDCNKEYEKAKIAYNINAKTMAAHCIWCGGKRLLVSQRR